jgi:hypothetical protein
MEAVESHLGVRPCGIRNHLLRFSQPETWRAQEAARFAYDATWGKPNHLGAHGERHFPFFPYDPQEQRTIDILELPITVMDATVFRYHKLTGQAALEGAWQAIQPTVAAGGLVSLLWHNNYFNEPEYWDWQMVYEELLARLAPLKPWCATGAEVNQWWRTQWLSAYPHLAKLE